VSARGGHQPPSRDDRNALPLGLLLREAERFNSTVGHENRGFLSLSHGFVPLIPPLTRLHRDFAAWDQLAAELPALHRTLALRRRVEELPLLDASEQNLENGEVLRAAALLAIVAHAYCNVEPSLPDAIPATIAAPWQQLRARLGRSQEVLSYIDLVVYNWKVVDSTAPDPLRVENMTLLLPTVDNREERVFYLTQLEILWRARVIVQAFARAHQAIAEEDASGVERALVDIIAALDHIVSDSLLKINPNPYSATHVDPVVWAKTVAPLAVPLHHGDLGPSGTSSPIFNALDLFFGRSRRGSFLGREITQLGAHYPPFWRDLLEALGRVSLVAFVERIGSSALTGAYREALELYSGENGFLGRHRMKVYGYLELAFKVGRAVTIGGFSGAFSDRTWDLVDSELEMSRGERLAHRSTTCQHAAVTSVIPAPEQGASGVRRVSLDVAGSGARYRVGSRCAVLPENGSELVQKTLDVLRARGDEVLPLTEEWQTALRLRVEATATGSLAIRELLQFGCIRPVTPRIAEALHAKTQDPRLLAQIEAGTTERWELWELIALLVSGGLDPRTLWQDAAGVADDRLCRLIPPERFRLYSISLVEGDGPDTPPRTLELTVGQLRYQAEPARLSLPPPSSSAPAAAPAVSGCPIGFREGTASSFLSYAKATGRPVPFRIERPARFQPPRDASQPLILFAAGTGVAPYYAFIQERARTPNAAPCWLLLSLRTPSDFLLADELKRPLELGCLRLDVAFTRQGASLSFDAARGFVWSPGPTRRIEDLISEPERAAELWRLVQSRATGGPAASVFVCGRSSFASTVLSCLERAFERRSSSEEPPAARSGRAFLRRLVGENRLVLELHTDAKPIVDESRWLDVSEVAEHNDAKAGYWLIIDQVVYDLTEFAELHPGGRAIVQAYAGIDAGHGYSRAHHRQPDVDAMREMYRIGRIRPLTFEAFTAKVSGPRGAQRVSLRAAHQAWVRALHLVVEMQNAHEADVSLQEAVVIGDGPAAVKGRYKMSRAAETHLRFLQNCLKPLRSETFPALWLLTQSLFAPDEGPSFMEERLHAIGEDARARHVRSISRALLADLSLWLQREAQFARVLAAAQAEDTRLLVELKRELLQGLRVFEKLEFHTRQSGSATIARACRRLPTCIEQYYERLERSFRQISEDSSIHAQATSQWPAANVRRLHDSEFWVLEEFPEQHIAVLYRTPLPAPSLVALAADNEALLSALREEHRGFGLVVDTRQAPLRNDKDFEATMARLRVEITSHFKRSAVLLETSLGELQAQRLERDEGRNTLVTRSVSAAFRFAAGAR
jgi:sulfite reductase alpha subunit-like flavoprotein/cytochrome b involved in lipid metabolism